MLSYKVTKKSEVYLSVEIFFNCTQRKGLVEVGGLETPPPERPPIYITDVQLLTNVHRYSVRPQQMYKRIPKVQ